MDTAFLDATFIAIGAGASLAIHAVKRISPKFEDWFDNQLDAKERQAWVLRFGLLIMLFNAGYQVWLKASQLEDFSYTFDNLLPIALQVLEQQAAVIVGTSGMHSAIKHQLRSGRGGGLV